MKHLTSLLTVLLLAFAPQLWGQTTYLSGVLIDQETKNPISYARIAPLDQPKAGGLSNVDGVFRINWSQDVDSVLIRHLNYGQVKIEVASLEDTVWLTPVPIVLDEVPIFSESPKELWKRVIDHFDENHYHREVVYKADVRAMIYNLDREVLHYASQSQANLYYEDEGYPQIGDFVISRNYLSELGVALAGKDTMQLFELSRPDFFKTNGPFFKKSSTRKFGIEVERSFVQEEKYLAEIHLTSKRSEPWDEIVFLIDLETYGIVRARAERAGRSGKGLGWYEVAFERVGAKYYKTYTDNGYSLSPNDPCLFQVTTNFDVVEGPSSKEIAHFFSIVFNSIKEYQIPWDDPSWQSRPSVPWPDWVAEQLETAGLAR